MGEVMICRTGWRAAGATAAGGATGATGGGAAARKRLAQMSPRRSAGTLPISGKMPLVCGK